AHAAQIAFVRVDELGLRTVLLDGAPVQLDRGQNGVERRGGNAALERFGAHVAQEGLKRFALVAVIRLRREGACGHAETERDDEPRCDHGDICPRMYGNAVGAAMASTTRISSAKYRILMLTVRHSVPQTVVA